MRFRQSVGLAVVVIFIGALIGSVLGEVVGLLLPDGVVKEFFLKSVQFGFSPTTLNLVLLTFTIGITMKINIVGVIGIFLASYIFRWYT